MKRIARTFTGWESYMNVFFDKCSAAVDFAAETKAFGIYHSTENNPNLNIHTHECCELLLCIKGGNNFLIDDKIYKAEDNDLFVINQFEAHKITLCGDVERYTVQIHPEFLFSNSTGETDLSHCFYSRGENFSNRVPLKKDEAEALVNILSDIKDCSGYGDDVLKNIYMIRLLVLVNRFFKDNHPAAAVGGSRLSGAVMYINRHLSDELTLDMIAKNSYMSVNGLCRVFKESLGTTVMKYIIGKRISQAKKYLKSGKSVSETAFLCGFHDYSNFIRTFTKTVGCSPGKYKKK